MRILVLKNHKTPFFTYEYYKSSPVVGVTSLPRVLEGFFVVCFFGFFVVALVTAGHGCSGLHYLLHTIPSGSISSSLANQCHALAVGKLRVRKTECGLSAGGKLQYFRPLDHENSVVTDFLHVCDVQPAGHHLPWLGTPPWA